ncbi:hypothetical protein TPHA_0J02500 [Tetrapisispora phaffii CBS 4417]|uniref:Bms1-type G domain-containing protein n=1 Tax=Tetrapisispora phaffii (strain ATCC 24235 / CBS 4417 / NBRC 1672 / NRRL Y-8282 / UCD 70-5) TaxID=1071381 RepID=G8BYX8_TETPH|nr:hypothetical protein TPHA_0J02500 [Tetrapisispora phaffii CBS 4417]CCE65070.1 hypothetical protein TPHA_0J02500 [Tetrapisispora phaffii CBS 4417]
MEQSNKAHRKTKEKNTAKKVLHSQGHNAKAFAVSAPGKMARQMLRTSDVNERKLHVPMIDRTPDDDPPPVIVSVVGPKGTGKTTLIKSLIRRLTKASISEVNGPITVVSGKRRRITLIECPADDLNAMIDIAKISDLVLMMIDGNFGFEMETMEFLNLAQHHGMPRVIGICTHLDLFKSQSTLRASKKRLKHRFWTEVYPGAKLFYLSGVLNGRYPDREILNLSRFISVMKFRPLKWRNEHPYLLADRITDITHPEIIEKEGIKVDRKVALYGYLHGTPISSTPGTKVHIAGVGDYSIAHIEKLPDPCPTPYFQQKIDDYEREKLKEELANGGTPASTVPKRRKRLENKDKLIYAPMSDVGGVLMDKDAVYINTGHGKNKIESFVPGEEKGEGEKLVTNLQSAEKSISERFDGVGIQLFSNGTELQEVNEDNDNLSESDIEEDVIQGEDQGRTTMRKAKVYSKSTQNEDGDIDNINSEDEDGMEEEGYNSTRKPKLVDIDFHSKNDELAYGTDSEFELSDQEDWQQASAKKLKSQFNARRKWDITKLIYMDNISPEECIKRWKGESQNADSEESDIEDEEEEDFFKKKDGTLASKHNYGADLERFVPYFDTIEKLVSKWTNNKSLKSRFIGAPLANAQEEKGEEVEVEENSDGELYGDFVDLENAESSKESKDEEQESAQEKGDEDNASDDSFADFDKEEKEELTVAQQREMNASKKEKLRLQFEMEEGENFKENDPDNEYDTWYELQKAKIAKQLDINNAEYEKMTPEQRQSIEGFKAGSYVRIVFDNVPMEFIENFDPQVPVVMGGLLPTELKFGVINARLRRHRWHKKILKSNDPLVLSLGWRRFQTLPVYTTSDSRTRTRFLKYTPEHTYCTASFYGPLCSPNTPFCGVQVVSNSDTTGSFRISATGIVEEIDASVEIVKKLKLVGYPYKIFKNTAFIKDMFSSAMEVARFEGAQIKTVSGIRGEIKRALSKPEGCYRAAFEDKIIMSDVVILRSWYPVQIKRFYNPVTSLLLKNKTEWKGVRLTGKIRFERSLETPMNNDSAYKKIERQERHFNGLKVPKSIQRDLPFKSQIHQMKKQKKKTYMQKRAVVLNGEEKKARATMQQVLTISRAKDEKKRAKKDDQRKERLKRLAKAEEEKSQKDKEKKKEYFSKHGKKRNNDDDEFSSSKRRK